jgi:hypothetical protein
MQNYVNDFFTVNCNYFLSPSGYTNNSQYVNVTGYNSIIIINTGLLGFFLTGRSFLIFPGERFYVKGNDNEFLAGNLYIEFLTSTHFTPPLPLGQALFIRKKYI